MTAFACLLMLVTVMHAEHKHLRCIVLAFVVIAALAMVTE